MRGILLLAGCILVSGCAVRLHGHEHAGDGRHTTVVAGAVSGSVRTSGARLAISAGQPVSPAAPGGHARISGDGALILIAGLVIADTVHYLATRLTDPPRQNRVARHAIADTCSCYGYNSAAPAADRRRLDPAAQFDAER